MMTENKAMKSLIEKLEALISLRRGGDVAEQVKRSEGLRQLKREVEDAYDNMIIDDSQYRSLLHDINAAL